MNAGMECAAFGEATTIGKLSDDIDLLRGVGRADVSYNLVHAFPAVKEVTGVSKARHSL